jgi:hypothetical protein
VRNGKHAYPRYFFTNSSADILEFFRQTCDAVGISHRDSNVNTISVARRRPSPRSKLSWIRGLTP